MMLVSRARSCFLYEGYNACDTIIFSRTRKAIGVYDTVKAHVLNLSGRDANAYGNVLDIITDMLNIV